MDGKSKLSGQVTLREVRDSDLPIFYEQQSDPEATAMAAFPSREREAFMAHWAKIRADPSVGQQTILFDGQVAGNIVVFGLPDHREVGYWLGKEFWGKCIATRALQAFMQQVTERPLFAHVAKHNTGSRRVAEKSGFRLWGEGRTPFEGREVEDFILILAAEEPGQV